jgi:hypothetical protein
LNNFANISNTGTALPALPADSEISIQMAFDKLTGAVYWAGSGAGVSFSYALLGAAIGIDPYELDITAPAVCAGTTASVTANPGVAGTYTYA